MRNVVVLVEGVVVIASTLKTWAAMVLTAALAAGLVAQTARLLAEQAAHQKLQLQVAKAERDRAAAALQIEQSAAQKEFAHATATQQNADAFTTAQPARDAAARDDLAIAQRLRVDAERRASTYRAMSEACAAARGDLADRLIALDAHIVRGAEVVAGLTAALEQRDAEVALLAGQISADRVVMENDE